MELYVDNKNINSYFGLKILDYTGLYSFPSDREDERIWFDKSGVDRNLSNIRQNSKEFVLKFLIKETDEIAAYNKLKTFLDYLYQKKVFVVSMRSNVARLAFLCRRSNALIPEVSIRYQNSLFVFDLGLVDINPKALKFYKTISALSVVVNYTKGQNADIYWGNGDRGSVSNSGNYTKSDYAANGLVDIIIDVDDDIDDSGTPIVVPPLVAEFSANVVSGQKALSVQFTDVSTGDVVLYSWNFGDGFTSSEKNPLHVYNESGTFTVTLQIFNATQGSATKVRTNYITVLNNTLLIETGSDLLIDDLGNKLLID